MSHENVIKRLAIYATISGTALISFGIFADWRGIRFGQTVAVTGLLFLVFVLLALFVRVLVTSKIALIGAAAGLLAAIISFVCAWRWNVTRADVNPVPLLFLCPPIIWTMALDGASRSAIFIGATAIAIANAGLYALVAIGLHRLQAIFRNPEHKI